MPSFFRLFRGCLLLIFLFPAANPADNQTCAADGQPEYLYQQYQIDSISSLHIDAFFQTVLFPPLRLFLYVYYLL